MTGDTDFLNDTTDVVDPAYLELFGSGLDDVEEAKREVGIEPIARFDRYHVEFQGATSGFSKTASAPYVRPTVKILAGPEGSVGRFISDDIYFTVKDTVGEKDKVSGEYVERPRTPEEKAKVIQELRSTLKRIATQLGLERLAPPSLTEEGLALYASCFGGKEAILAIRVEKARGDFDARNRIVWRSISAPSGPASKPDKFGTALEEALSAIEKSNAKGKTAGSRTASGLKAAKASEFI
jgi:plasmid stabilization system protein ParE